MAKPTSKFNHRPGFRKSRTAAEQRFCDGFQPNLREWALKKTLSVDEAATLSMGLDPRSLEYIEDAKTFCCRFLATKSWFLRNEAEFPGGLDLEGICVVGSDMGDDNLALPPGLETIVDLKQAGYLDADAKLARLERKMKRLEDRNSKLSHLLAKTAIKRPTKLSKTAVTKVDLTDAKIIVALIAGRFDETERTKEFIKLKTGKNSHLVSAIKQVLWSGFGWKIDEDTVLSRIRAVTEAYQIDQRGKLSREQNL